MIAKSLRSDEDGAAAVQYAVAAGILSAVVLVSSQMLGGSITDLYSRMTAEANEALLVQPAAGPPPASNDAEASAD